MNIVIAGDSIVLTSSLKVEDIQLAQKFDPSILEERDEEGNVIFSVSYNEGHSSIADFGVTFGGKSHDSNGNATITRPIPSGVDAKKYAVDLIAGAADKLEAFEKSIATKAKALSDKKKKLEESITIVGDDTATTNSTKKA